LSIRTTALVRVPYVNETYLLEFDPAPPTLDSDVRPPGLHKENTTIELYIDDELIIANGSASGSIFLEGGEARWYNLEI
jgi:hypothetical protein